MLTRYIFAILLLGGALTMRGQEILNWVNATALTDAVKEPSPEVASYGKFADDELSLATGTGTLTVPLYTVTSGSLSIPISMSYSLRAYKTEEMSGWLGLGWTLNAGGAVTRHIVGHPDDGLLDIKDPDFFKNNDMVNGVSAYLTDLMGGRKDCKHDLYSYNVGGYSGNFIMQKNDEGKMCIVQLPETDLKIYREALGFKICAPDSTIYMFQESEGITYKNVPFRQSGINTNIEYTATTTWHLSSITSPQGEETAVFEYETAPRWVRSHHRTGKSYSIYRERSWKHQDIPQGETPDINGVNQTIFLNQRVLKRISTRCATIEMDVELLEDKKTDLQSPAYISGIKVKSPEGSIVRDIKIKSGRRIDTRRYVSGVEIWSGEELLDKRDFQYDVLSHSASGDLFGYPNASSGYNSKMNVFTERCKFNENRMPDSTMHYIKSGTLRKYETNTGLEVNYTYEPSASGELWYGCNISSGLRIKQIEVKDRASGRTRLRSFTYEKPVCSIDLNSVGVESFIQLSGSSNGWNQWVITSTLTDKSRAAGHPFENLLVYYGLVRETVSGTDLETPLVTEYRFDTSRSTTASYAGYGYGPENESSYNVADNKIRFPGEILLYNGSEIRPSPEIFKVRPLTGSLLEMYMTKSPLVCKTKFRQTADGKEVPVEKEEYKYKIFDMKLYHTGFHYEILIMSSPIKLDSYSFKKLDDITYSYTGALTARTLCDTVIRTKYYEGGDSVRIVTRNEYGTLPISTVLMDYTIPDRLPDLRPGRADSLLKYTRACMMRGAAKVTQEIYPERVDTVYHWDGPVIPTTTITDYGGYRVEHRKLYTGNGADKPLFMNNPMRPLQDRIVVNGCDTMIKHYEYGFFNGVSRPTRIFTRRNSGAVSDELKFYSYDSHGHPTGVRRMGQPRMDYGWEGDMLASSRIAGTDIGSDYESIPLVGYTKITSAHGASRSYGYSGGRLVSEALTDGTVIARYGYSFNGSGEAGNRITTELLAGAGDADFSVSERVFDGFGDEIGQITSGFGGDGSDVGVFCELDAVGRTVRQWVALPVDARYGVPSGSALASASQSQYADKYGFTRNDYLGYPGTGTVAVTAAGAGMQEYASRSRVRLNGASGLYGCLRYSVDGENVVCHGAYAAGELTVSESLDPEGHVALTFTDMLGRKVLERRCEGNVEDPGVTADTYYICDTFGAPLVVLQPMAQKEFGVAGSRGFDDDVLRRYAFVYRYDERGRLRSLRVPGAEAVETIYDDSGRVCYTRDGNMRARGLRRYVLYDNAGRPAEEGVCRDLDDESLWTAWEPASVAAAEGDSAYACVLKPADAKPYKVYFYDDYEAAGRLCDSVAAPAGCNMTPTGLVTAVRTAVFGADDAYGPAGYDVNVKFYDAEGNIVRSYTEDYKNNSYLADMEYTPSGKVRVLTESAVHDGMSYGARTVTDYDRHGRVTAVRASAGDGAEVAAATYGYDGIGRLWKTAVPGLETVRGYNVRGNLTSIQSPVYEETLRYEDGVMTPTVTGRISERDFRLYGDLWRSYYYSYDGMGRMASAQSRDESAHSWGRLALNREFDLNGNITKILRQGAIARGVYGVTDDAELEYDGNQIMGVTENAPGVNLETSADIPPGDFGEDSFGYDANGNMTSDGTRGIADIVYSAANRPLRITMADGRKIDYVYDADGVKLEATEPFKALTGTELRAVRVERPTLPVLMSRRYYRGGFEFRDGSMSRYNVGPGYFGYDGTYYSNITDYQGNIVAVTSADSAGGFNIHQLNAYYPDGQPVAAEALVNGGARPVVKVFEDNRYKFGAKELTTTYGADFYDFEARMLGTGIPAFMSIDPKVIDYQGVSPYAFCMNDPVNYVDPSGESGLAVVDNENKKIVVESHFFMYGPLATTEICDIIVGEIADAWNIGATININGTDYEVEFSITYDIVSEDAAAVIAKNNDSPRNNFALVDNYDNRKDGGHNVSRTSIVDPDNKDKIFHGANSFYFNTSDLQHTSSFAHEYGHGLGLHHPRVNSIEYTLNRFGYYEIMNAQGTHIFNYVKGDFDLIDPNLRFVSKKSVRKAFNNNWGNDTSNSLWNKIFTAEF